MIPSFAAAAPPAPPPLEAYGDLPAVEEIALAPDGKSIAFVAKVEDKRSLVVLDAEKKVRAVVPVGDAKVRDLKWADSQHPLVTVSRMEALGVDFTKSKAELGYTAVVPMDGKPLRFIFDKKGLMLPYVAGWYGHRTLDGKTVGFVGGQEQMLSDKAAMDPTVSVLGNTISRRALFAVDLDTMELHKVAQADQGDHWRQWLVGADGKVKATMLTQMDSGSWSIRSDKGAQLATGTEPTGDVDLIAMGEDGASIIFRKREGADKAGHYYKVPLAGGMPAEILQGVDIERLWVDDETGVLLGYLPASGAEGGQPVMFDAAKQARMRSVYRAFRDRHVTIEDFTANVEQVLARTSGNGDPGTWYLVDLPAHKADQVGDERPTIPGEAVGPISVITYKAADGLEMSGVLTLPPGRAAKNLPVILLPHGRPYAHDVAEFDWWAQGLASRGYAVFQPNFRGSTDRDAAFMHAGDGQWGRKMQTDISDGLAELARQGIVDPKRACIVGGSYGGYAALAGVTLQQGLYRCAVAVAPVSDVGEMSMTDKRWWGYSAVAAHSLRESLGDPSGYAAISPRRHAAEANAPILLVHGRDDTVVPLSQSSRMADALKAAGKPYEMVVMDKEDHWLSRAETRKAMLAACVGFVMKYNPPD